MSVYFVTAREVNAVKIGNSNDPVARLGEIQWGCPCELKLEAIIDGDQEVEFALHRRFADDRIRGEWFRITEMIEAMMAQVPTPDQPKKTRVPRAKKARPAASDIRARHEAYVASVRAGEMRALKRRIASGDIHFPFRAQEKANA